MCVGMVGVEVFFCEWFGEVYCYAVCSHLVRGEVHIVNCFAGWERSICTCWVECVASIH